jgi:hypothetical protein
MRSAYLSFISSSIQTAFIVPAYLSHLDFMFFSLWSLVVSPQPSCLFPLQLLTDFLNQPAYFHIISVTVFSSSLSLPECFTPARLSIFNLGLSMTVFLQPACLFLTFVSHQFAAVAPWLV